MGDREEGVAKRGVDNAFTAAESDARIASHGYRITPPAAKPDPSQRSVREMSIKPWLEGPGSDGQPVAAGRRRSTAWRSVDWPVSRGSRGRSTAAGPGARPGAIGPVLDESRPDAARVAAALRNGIGIGVIPSDRDTLTDARIAALVAYVSAASGAAK